jgi:hypothetical protein
MNTKPVGIAAILAVTILAVVLLSGRSSQAQVTNQVSASYAYKVERFGYGKPNELETQLNNDARNGFRVLRVMNAGAWHDTIIVVLEKPAGAP